MCFTYSNDERLTPLLPHIFKTVGKPIWLTDFSNLEYPFKSVKKENRRKLLYGRLIDMSHNNDGGNRLKIPELEKQLSELMGKRSEPDGEEAYGSGSCQEGSMDDLVERNKLLKIDKLEPVGQGAERPGSHLGLAEQEVHMISSNSNDSTFDKPTAGIFGPSHGRRCITRPHGFIDFGELNLTRLLKLEELDSYLTFSVSTIIKEIEQNAPFCRKLRKIDPEFFEHLHEANNTLLNKMSKDKFFFDPLILRNMLCLYFSSHEFTPFKFIKKIPEEAVVGLLTKIDQINIQKVTEVFLRVIFDKITTTLAFSFEEEFKKIRFCSKLYSIKRVHVKRILISTFYSSSVDRSNLKKLIEKGKINLKNSQKNSVDGESVRVSDQMSDNGLPYTENFSLKYRTNLLVVQDGYLTLTCNEMIGMFNISVMSGSFFSCLPEEDLNQFSMIIAEKDLTKIPVVEEVLKMEKERNQVLMEQKFLDMKNRKANSEHDKGRQGVAGEPLGGGSSVKLGSMDRENGAFEENGMNFLGGGGDVGGTSACSDFSFNLMGNGPMPFNFNFFNF